MLELKNVSKYYSNNGVVTLGLRNINLRFKAGEIVAITGDSGSGKSTLLNVITAVDTYEEGEIYFQGNETSYFNQNDMDMFRKNHISFIFQNYNIIDSYTVLENVMLPLILNGKSFEEARKEAIEIIDKVGLTKRIKHKGTKLSGGEKQRCVIARALTGNAKILACDEPTGNLDSETGAEIIKLIQEVAQDRLVLIVTHNYEQVKDIITRRIKVSDGEIVEDVQLSEHKAYEEERTELKTEESSLKFSSLLKLALKNILSTPKRTILSSIVFFVVSLFSLVLCLLAMQFSYDAGYETNTLYGIATKDQIVAFNNLHKGLDKEELETTDHYEIYYNNFYESIEFVIGYERQVAKPDTLSVHLTLHKINYEILEGKDCRENSKEAVLVFPKDSNSYLISKNKKFLNKMMCYISGEVCIEEIGTITGIAISEEVNRPYIYTDEVSEEVINLITNQDVKGYYQIDGQELQPLQFATYVSGLRTHIACPMKFKDRIDFSFLFGNLYAGTYDIPIIYYEEEDSLFPTLYPVLAVYSNYQQGKIPFEFDEIYEATIYSHDIKKTKTQLEQAGIEVTMPSRVNGDQVNIAVLYLFIGIIVISLICLFFISYIILSRIYASKTNEYGIMRTLGLIKKRLDKIVLLENVGIGMTSSILSLVLFVIVDAIYPIMRLGNYLSWIIILVYFSIVFLFSLLIARRFNRRLFKFSVNTTLKGEVARND